MAEQQARQEWDQEKADTPESPMGEDPRVPGLGKPGGDKPKRPSSLLTGNNVMKLKQMIPLQGKFTTTSPTGSEPKLPGFLNFKFLKSPEMKKDPTAAFSAAAAATQSPSKSFNPGKLFHFTKSDGTDQHSKTVDSMKTTSVQQSNHSQTTTPEQQPSQEEDADELSDSDTSPSKKL